LAADSSAIDLAEVGGNDLSKHSLDANTLDQRRSIDPLTAGIVIQQIEWVGANGRDCSAGSDEGNFRKHLDFDPSGKAFSGS
jgi:hypothetical protein